MEKSRQGQFVGIAKFFNETQIRDLFIRYVSMIVVVEIFLLLIMLCGSVAVYKEPFPTKLYLILALSMPLGITFLLGIFVMAFNKFIFGRKQSKDKGTGREEGLQVAWFSKSDQLLSKIHKIPFIAKLFLTLLIIPVLFKLDDILAFYAGIGVQTVQYIVIIGLILIGIAAIVGVIWLIANFRLKKSQMDYEYRYRKDIMDKLGLMVLSNNAVIDRNGRVISIEASTPAEGKSEMMDVDYEIRSLPLKKEL